MLRRSDWLLLTFVENFIGAASTSGNVPTTIVTTTALST
ncbi:hypothetical protein Tco_0689063, partial [Tanacetum coccineum]